MQLEVGMVLEGKVTGITKFGAFIELPGGKTGMVHISEVAPTFVKEIRDFVQEEYWTIDAKLSTVQTDVVTLYGRPLFICVIVIVTAALLVRS